MTKELYLEKLKSLENRHNLNILELKTQFAYENNPYKIGDIIEDHIGKGKILDWSLSLGFGNNTPALLYVCTQLTKKGTPNKREPRRNFYQTNIISK